MSELSHFTGNGDARMVDVGGKEVSRRVAVAVSTVSMALSTADRIREGKFGKGDVLAVARLAGIQSAKLTSQLIPLCHVVPLDSVEIDFRWRSEMLLEIQATVSATARTGVEMEALTAVSVAGLTVYDMCKSVDREMVLRETWLQSKSGGTRGDYQRSGRIAP